MDIIATQIRQIGREIVLEGNSIIGYQHSANLYVKLIKDESHDNPFAGMVLSAYCSALSEQMPIACPLEEREDGTYILLNHKVFEQHGDVYLSLGGMNEEAVVVTSNNLVLQVDESNNIIAYVSPAEEYWQMEVLNAMRVWYANVVDPVFCENKEKLNQLFQQTEEHEEKAEELQTKVEQQQEQVDILLTDANTVIQQASASAQAASIATEHANTAAAQANDSAQAANTAKANAETAATNANEAAQAANDITEEINRQLQAGELKGDPGSRILYGSGAPIISSSIAGDWYYDTDSEFWDVYYKSIESGWTKMGQIKGGLGGDTLPIGAMIPSALSMAPEGWLLCDGSEVSRSDYSELFHVIGESYGAGDGETTFALPNEPNPLLYAKEGNMIQFMEREPALYIMIKAKQIVPVSGGIVNDAENESETDALSAKALKQIVSGLEQRLQAQIVNPNLLINGDFRIRQRGETFAYSGDGSSMYMQDRWIFAGSQSGTFTIANDGSMAITTATENTSTYRQYVELTPVLKRQIEEAQYKLTLSVGIDAMIEHQAGIRVSSSDVVSYPLKNGYNCIYHTFTLTEDDLKGTYLDVVIYAAIYPETSVTAIPVWAKLELGTFATPFYSRLYAEELALCQRYYIKDYPSIGVKSLDYEGENKYLFELRLPTLRTLPTVTVKSCSSFVTGGSGGMSAMEIVSSNYRVTSNYSGSIYYVIAKSTGTMKQGACGAVIRLDLDAEIY